MPCVMYVGIHMWTWWMAGLSAAAGARAAELAQTDQTERARDRLPGLVYSGSRKQRCAAMQQSGSMPYRTCSTTHGYGQTR